MTRLLVAAVASFAAIGCGGASAPTESAPSPAPSTSAATSAPTAAATPAAEASDAPSLPAGLIDGGSGWGVSASALALGDRARFTCPPPGEEYSIWGTAIYTSDSSVCTAAVHSGLLSFEGGGEAVVTVIEGQESYVGTTQNGVTSRDYTSYTASFTFRDAPAPVGTPATSERPSGPPTGSDLSPEAQQIMAHVPDAISAGECGEVTSFDGGVIASVQCINIPDLAGYVVYTSFDTSANLATSFDGNYEFFGADSNAQDCSVGPSLVAHERGGISEGRLMCNDYESSGPDDLIAIWFDDGLLLESTLVAYGSTYPEMYATYLGAAAIE